MSNKLDLLDILDENLSINDLNELGATFHCGSHLATISWEAKMIGQNEKAKAMIECTFTLRETRSLEGVDAEKTPQKGGTKTSMLFQLDGNMSEGKLRAILDALSPSVGSDNAVAVIKGSEGMEVLLETGKRTGRVPDGGGDAPVYFDLKSIQVV